MFGATLAFMVAESWAFALGIPLDGFITTLTTSVTGLGLLVGLIGATGWIYSQMDGVHSSLLAGSVNYFTKAGVLGGAATICGALGLVGGAVLP